MIPGTRYCPQMTHSTKMVIVIHDRDIYICKKALIIDNACLVVYLILIIQCLSGTQKIGDDPKNLLMSIKLVKLFMTAI